MTSLTLLVSTCAGWFLTLSRFTESEDLIHLIPVPVLVTLVSGSLMPLLGRFVSRVGDLSLESGTVFLTILSFGFLIKLSLGFIVVSLKIESLSEPDLSV